MMVLKRYIAKTIILATGMAALVITSVVLLMTMLGEMKDIGTGDYHFVQAIFYVLLRLPNELYKFSPMLTLLGSILGLSILSSYQELAVMRTSGYGIRRIICSVLSAVFFLIVLITLIGEWIGPGLSNHAEIRKEYAQNAGQAVITASGVWFHVDNNFIHVRRVMGRQLLEEVTRYQFDNAHRLQAAYFAQKMALENNIWVMDDVLKTTFYSDRTKSEAFPQIKLDLKFNPNLLNVGLVDPSEMSLPKLLKFSRYLRKNGLQTSQYMYEFWQRALQPFAALIMVFLAIPFVLSAFKSSTLGWRMVIGFLTGFIFFIMNALLGQLCIVYQVPTFFAALFPLLLFTGIGIFLCKRLVA